MNITTRRLITDPPPSGLGYCCLYAFFCRHKQTALIAARLGVSTRAVQYLKAEVKAGAGCEARELCLKKIGALRGTRPLR